jgi:rhamnosyltransferase
MSAEQRGSDPRVSIVLLTLDGAATLPALLRALRQQRTDFAFEIIAIDSGSGDETPGILRGSVDRLIQIAPASFNHGLTRNLGCESARGRALVMLVQDAVPATRDWLQALAAPVLEGGLVAGSYGRQLPRAEASRIARRMLARWVASQPQPRRQRLESAAALERLPPGERLRACAFDNVCSCISRAVWREHPFAETSFAEDLAWAKEVLLCGYELVYLPDASVYHSHDRSLCYELQRTISAHRRLHELFELRTVPSLPRLAEAMGATLLDHLGCLLTEPGPRPDPDEVGRALGLALVWPLGQYLGGGRHAGRLVDAMSWLSGPC